MRKRLRKKLAKQKGELDSLMDALDDLSASATHAAAMMMMSGFGPFMTGALLQYRGRFEPRDEKEKGGHSNVSKELR